MPGLNYVKGALSSARLHGMHALEIWLVNYEYSYINSYATQIHMQNKLFFVTFLCIWNIIVK